MKILLLGADGQLGYELHRSYAPLGDILPYTYTGKLAGRQSCGQIDFSQEGALEALVREHMGNAYPLNVPLEVSVGYGGSWDSAAH